jgi:prevent-host-death family protein
MIKTVSFRELRERLAGLLDDVARGEQIVVTRRGKRVARIVPEGHGGPLNESPYSLRGSVHTMSKDFDAPIQGLWEALKS